ncbi:3083_t:CDS:1, partial [Entrophospora sp. SA101]
MLAIPHNGALNPKILDDELIMKHLDDQFITNLGVSYNDHMQDYIGNECSDDELMNRLTLHSYNDRLVEKKTDWHVQNAILFDFVEGNLKGVEGYMKALQIIHDQEPMQAYLSNYAIPIVADWPGQFFICKAIIHWLLNNNETIPSFATAFLPIMGPLHGSLNGHELVFKENSTLFNDVYKGLFDNRKDLGKKPRPWRIDLILHIMQMAWLDIDDIVYSKFGRTCKNIEFLYLTNLLSNLIPLVLDVYTVQHQEGNCLAYEEA